MYLKTSYPLKFPGTIKTVWIETTHIIKGNLRKLMVCDVILSIFFISLIFYTDLALENSKS